MEPMRSLGFADIAADPGDYKSIGSSVDHPVRMYELHNFTDVNLVFSIDGVDDHFPLEPDGYKVIDIATNKSNDNGWYLGQGTYFYVKPLDPLVVPTSGGVYLCIAYGN